MVSSAFMKRGFSLVELSIVLVILGLLTGGILAGQSLIRASELRAASTEANRYTTAVQTFRDKYFAMPGDFSTATKFWGTASGGCPAGARSGTQTCDGNGNGDMMANNEEMYLFWQHLANAGLIEGSYTGYTGPGHAQYDANGGVNVPVSRMNNGLWTARSINISGAAAGWFDTRANIFELGAKQVSYWNENPLFKPEELWNIDTKMDDGKPATGKVNAFYWDTCTNAANSADRNAAYKLDDSALRCVAVFVNIF